MWTKLGIASLCLAVIALAYPTLHGVIGLGYSDKLNIFPQSTIEILGAEWFLWINHIPVRISSEGPTVHFQTATLHPFLWNQRNLFLDSLFGTGKRIDDVTPQTGFKRPVLN